MKKYRSLYLVMGFIAGVAYIAACGGSTSGIADTIASALDVSYDNTTSGLSATTVQGAIDEVAESTGSSVQLSSSSLVGTWTVESYRGVYKDQITFSDDNSYSSEESTQSPFVLCDDSQSFIIVDDMIVLERTCGTSPEVLKAALKDSILYIYDSDGRLYKASK